MCWIKWNVSFLFMPLSTSRSVPSTDDDEESKPTTSLSSTTEIFLLFWNKVGHNTSAACYLSVNKTKRKTRNLYRKKSCDFLCYHEKSVTTTSILWFLFTIPFASHLIHLYIYFVYSFREHAILHFSIRCGSWLCEKCAHAYQIHRPLMLHVMQYTPRHF